MDLVVECSNWGLGGLTLDIMQRTMEVLDSSQQFTLLVEASWKPSLLSQGLGQRFHVLCSVHAAELDPPFAYNPRIAMLANIGGQPRTEEDVSHPAFHKYSKNNPGGFKFQHSCLSACGHAAFAPSQIANIMHAPGQVSFSQVAEKS